MNSETSQSLSQEYSLIKATKERNNQLELLMADLHNFPAPKSPNICIPDSQETFLWEDFIVKEEFYKDGESRSEMGELKKSKSFKKNSPDLASEKRVKEMSESSPTNKGGVIKLFLKQKNVKIDTNIKIKGSKTHQGSMNLPGSI